jgi:hypothetical protein
MKKINPRWDALLESLKEPLRLMVLAFIAWLIGMIVPQLDPTWQAIFIIVLRWVDKYVYEFQKTEKNAPEYKGIIGF